MLFYFTGTGNSLAAAKALAKEGEGIINMAEARKKGAFAYTRRNGERAGFIFPEYCGTVNDVVVDFIRHLELTGKGYNFAVITCGGAKSIGGGYLSSELIKRGIPLHYCCHLTMPDNAITVLDTPDEKETAEVLRKAEERLAEIKEALRQKTSASVKGSGIGAALRPVYHAMNRTKPFFAENSCIGCGRCAKTCPDSAIEMRSGKPVWTKAHCTFCCACINRCPVQAIQYGKKTASRRRYVHPILENH